MEWSAKIMRYLKQTSNYRLTYEKCNLSPTIYSDFDFSNDVKDSLSVSGFVIVMSKGAIAWESKKQASIATSTTEAEYNALFETSKEVI